jgi:formate dehydrogenase major subunit
VVLPATAWPEKDGTVTNTDRMVQLGRKAIEPPGDAREDLLDHHEIGKRMGSDWKYAPAATFSTRCAGHDFDRRHHLGPAGARSSVTYPVRERRRSGHSGRVHRGFPTPTGGAKFVPADIIPAAERPDAEFPFVLITGRQLEHWHTGAMTRRAGVLDAIEPDPTALMHPLDLDRIGAQAGDVITVESRRGIVSLYARADDGSPRGSVFIPFCYYEAAANLLTNAVLDPIGKIPEFKYCAVKSCAAASSCRGRRTAGARRSPSWRKTTHTLSKAR